MSKSYKGMRSKKNYVYSVVELRLHYQVCQNTISNWVRAGLHPSDGSKPYVFQGAELIRFHKDRRERGKHRLRIGEFYCLACKLPSFPATETLEILSEQKSKNIMVLAVCSECGSRYSKILNAIDWISVKKCIDTNTSLATIDEDTACALSGVGIKLENEVSKTYFENDRTIHEWLKFAGKYDPKTVDAHLVSIREFERHIGGLPFAKVTVNNISNYRNWLKDRVDTRVLVAFSRSTVRHRSSQLTKFFEWLLRQNGYRRLNKNLPEYFTLPKRQLAKALPKKERPYPSIEQAEEMVFAMPHVTLMDRRQRAMVAFAFLSGCRADTIISLRLCDLCFEKREIVQDAEYVRTKNGKSLNIRFFPIPKEFIDIVSDWKRELTGLIFSTTDPLFPSDVYLQERQGGDGVLDPIEPMKTSGPIREAFKIASRFMDERYTPHSARHTLAALGYKLCRTPEELNAWSKNLGHSSLEVTKTHYGAISDEDCFEIMGKISKIDRFSEDENELMIQFLGHEMESDDPNYTKAQRLVQMRRDNMRS
jgi:integrase